MSEHSSFDTPFERVPQNHFTVEDKIDTLTPAMLSELSLDEYMRLWREKLNPYYVTHVTRQGFRDHVLIPQHLEGHEDFHTGLVSMLEDQKMLRTPLSLRYFKAGDEASLREWLATDPLPADDVGEAHIELHSFFATYQDKTAVHFGRQEVASHIYGGETGNESFVVFPSDFVASQYPFSSIPPDLTSDEIGSAYNEVFVWPPQDTQGIPVDAGIVFLPQDIPVDPVTGSRYASILQIVDGQEKRTVLKDDALIDAYLTWANSIDQSALYTAVYAQNRTTEQASLIADAEGELRQSFAPDIAAELVQKLAAAVEYEHADEKSLRREAEAARANWVRPDHTVPAQTYWEKHFHENPHQRPKHLVYYNGDPARAVSDFLERHGIHYSPHSADGPLLGFDRNHVNVDDIFSDPRSNTAEMQRLRAIGHQIIDKLYSQPTAEIPQTKLKSNIVVRALRALLERKNQRR